VGGWQWLLKGDGWLAGWLLKGVRRLTGLQVGGWRMYGNKLRTGKVWL